MTAAGKLAAHRRSPSPPAARRTKSATSARVANPPSTEADASLARIVAPEHS